MLFRLGEIAEVINAELKGDPECVISGAGTLKGALPDQLSFLANRRYFEYLKITSAAAVVIRAEDVDHCPVYALIVKDPYLAFVKTRSRSLMPVLTLLPSSVLPRPCTPGSPLPHTP